MKELIFAVPGSKVFISKYYRNIPSSFLNISLTGSSCELQCRHCKGILLKDMIDGRGKNNLNEILEKYGQERVKGFLLSGGFDKNGLLHINEDILNDIKSIKTKMGSKIKIYIHAGFVDRVMAIKLKESLADGILVNVISSNKAIKNIYNLKDKSPEDYYYSIGRLKENGLKVSAHFIIGINNGRISEEFKSIEKITGLGVDSIVFVILKKLSKEMDIAGLKFKNEELLDLIKYAKKLNPGIPITFGCAKPPGAEVEKLEIEIIKLGIDALAFPSEKSIEFALENNIKFKFVEECCAMLG
ncbi:MAG: hypothetical protein M1326_05670 [Cyanobacteria bacterium]|nr:hypothetical protein [Cyanobacteriota bacterium]